MIFPKAIQKGACVGLVAPSSPVTDREALLSVETLSSMGFQVICAESLQRGENLFGYLAGEAKNRADDLNRMFENPQVEAIFCVRGGYGSIQILEYLNYDGIRANPKIFTGYSDVTSLHCAIQKKCGLVTFHGPMVKSDFLQMKNCTDMDKSCVGAKRKDLMDSYTWESMWKAWRFEKELEFQNPPGSDFHIIRSGTAEGRLVGGNLSVLARLLGTPYVPEFKDRILFLEDVGEKIPRIHMYLTQLRMSGIFEDIRGVLLGNFTDCSNTGYEDSLTAEFFLKSWFEKLKIPVMGNLYSDHRHPMGTLPLGSYCKMDTMKGKITFFHRS